jgi:hypothetical protein
VVTPLDPVLNMEVPDMSLLVPGDRFSTRRRLQRIQRWGDIRHELWRDRLEARILRSNRLQTYVVRVQDRVAVVASTASNEAIDLGGLVLALCSADSPTQSEIRELLLRRGVIAEDCERIIHSAHLRSQLIH